MFHIQGVPLFLRARPRLFPLCELCASSPSVLMKKQAAENQKHSCTTLKLPCARGPLLQHLPQKQHLSPRKEEKLLMKKLFEWNQMSKEVRLGDFGRELSLINQHRANGNPFGDQNPIDFFGHFIDDVEGDFLSEL